MSQFKILFIVEFCVFSMIFFGGGMLNDEALPKDENWDMVVGLCLMSCYGNRSLAVPLREGTGLASLHSCA